MSIKWDEFTESECVVQTADDPLDCPTKPVPPVPDDGDGDGDGDGEPAFKLILKPEYALRQVGEAVQYRTFLLNEDTGEEIEVTMGLTYLSANINIAIIGATSGRAFGSSPGITSISVQWQDKMAFAQLEIVGDCSNVAVGMVMVVDRSESMAQPFSTPPVPAGQIPFATRFAAAKSYANRFAGEVDESKDYAGLVGFSNSAALSAALTQDTASVQAAVMGLSQTFNTTDIASALQVAIDELEAKFDAGTIDKKVIILFSDGENKGATDPVPIAEAFRNSGGVILVVGIRSHGPGYALLKQITTEGLFINALPTNSTDAGNILSGMKGYFCAGNCTPQGNEPANIGQLNYTEFINWDVLNGEVDLIGGEWPYELFNLLPGNGLYVDTAGSGPLFTGKLISKNAFALVAGRQYKLSFYLAGNQRQDMPNFQTRVRVENPENSIDETIVINEFDQDFTLYERTFVAPSSANAKISFQHTGGGTFVSVGNLLDRVKFEDLTVPSVLLEDNFDSENLTFIEPECVQDDLSLLEFGYGYCPATGCLNEPIPEQIPDPNPLPDPE